MKLLGSFLAGFRIKFAVFAALLMVLFSAEVYAQCSSPAGVAGEREWVGGSNKYQICNGTDWLDMSCERVAGCTPSSMTYQSQITDGGSWAAPIDSAHTADKNTLVLGIQWSGLVFLDISSSPSAPTSLGSISGSNYDDTNSVAVYGDYAFSAGRSGVGVVATDFSTPASPTTDDTVISSPTNEMTNLWGIGLTSDGQYAVTASWDSGSNNECHVHVIDISDPTAMSIVGHTDFSGVTGAGIYCTKVAIWGDYAFLSFADATTFGGIGVVDIGTKTAPSAVAFASNTSGNQAEDIALSYDGQYAFVSNRGDASVSSFDISTPTSPSFSDNYQNTTYLDNAYRLDVLGDALIATGDTDNGIVLLDVSDPTNMTLIATYSNVSNVDGAQSVSIVDRYAYIGGTANYSLSVFDLGCDSTLVCNTLGACTTAAEMEWDSTENAYKYCDGTNWIQTGCNADTCFDLGACSTAAQMRYAGGELQQCNGTRWRPMTE